jgi:hypothetical protein
MARVGGAVGYAASPSALRRRTVLFHYGGPRLCERPGTSVGTPSAVSKPVMLLGSVSMATIAEPSVVNKILSHLGMPTEPLPRARARDPTGQQSFDFHAA